MRLGVGTHDEGTSNPISPLAPMRATSRNSYRPSAAQGDLDFNDARPLVDMSGDWFEVWRLNAERCERIVQRTHDVQQRAGFLSHDLEHANETIGMNLRRD